MGGAFYIILNGQVEVFDYKPDQSINSFAVLKTGNMVGEIGAVLRQPRTAFVRTRTACCLLRYSGTFFDTVEANRQDLAVKMYKSMLRVLGDRINHQNELLHGDITGGEGQ
ncbi:MAG: cyclic nucleotide-binding domain-containing protein [Spartobacteria bacterium]|nr:cyclic nucleotide-binding domain-containing protein [Spartobacteria bacterium]